jgi:hypothetical protein
MAPITIYPSRWKNGIWLLINISIASIFAACLIYGKSNTQKDWLICLTSIVFFGLGAALATWRIINHRPLYIIDDAGFHNLRYGIVMPWSEISGQYVRKIQSADYVYLELNDPSKWWSRSKFTAARPWIKTTRQFLGVTERTGAMLELTDASVSTSKVVKAIQEMIDLQAGKMVTNGDQHFGAAH